MHIDEDVFGLDVAVDHPALMDVVQPDQQLAGHLLKDNLVDAHLLLLDKRE